MANVNLEEINKLLKERDDLLLTNPELIPFQDEVDGLMKEKADESPLLRSLRLNKMMLENLNKSYMETLSMMDKKTLAVGGET